jgi:outer membrane biosynthesis protein TonB
MGTPSYMAPEQMKGHRATGRSDQFSLAVVAFEMLAGAKPFTGESLATLVLKVVYESRPSLRALNARLPAAVDDVLRKALAQDGGDRYGSCGEFVMALEAALKTPVTAAVPFSSAGEPRERRHLVWGGAAAALLLAGATAYHMLRPTPPPPQLPEVKKTVTAPPLPVPTPVPRPKTVPPETPKPAPPKVVEFRAVPPALMRGERFMLNWNVTGASTVSISPGVGAVAPAGSQSLLASATSTYTLTATGQGGTTRAFASVAVSERLVLPAPLTGRTTMSGEALEPFLIRRGQPVYPAAARAAGVQGSVRFFATIGKDGKVTHLQALSGPPELLEAGADAAMQYRYRPVQRNGQPIEVDTEIFVVFRLPGR